MYTSRIVGFGKYQELPFVCFILASKSMPYRELRINTLKNRINVFPRKGYEDHPTNKDPEVDSYSCIRAGMMPSNQGAYLIAFNGHMTKRVEANLKEGMPPFTALDLTLLDFRGAHDDARIASLMVAHSDNNHQGYLGVNDIDREEKRILKYPNERIHTLDDRIIFIFDKDTNFEHQKIISASDLNAETLAEYLHKNIIDKEIFFGLGTGIALWNGSSFNFGAYNHPVDEVIVNQWQLKYQRSK